MHPVLCVKMHVGAPGNYANANTREGAQGAEARTEPIGVRFMWQLSLGIAEDAADVSSQRHIIDALISHQSRDSETPVQSAIWGASDRLSRPPCPASKSSLSASLP